ncbi:Asp23/Gls24 family envelope stress response protein [Caldanaerobacter subterraneus]|uniref:Asp23/Gls24 family envelope stress response protein n=1 Tax=Caldanaerobacter subterraneus TaxID=911092 RepID=UPI0006182BCB|nr:Asp23/Gls24 family envelope stress response protein [Caldanaerobacter subterraneus]
MKVYSLVGESGTGKSHHASFIAGKYGIRFIIDDGLLIKGNSIVAGISAKKEATKIGAIKRALFTDPKHAEEVKKAIAELKPDKILIIGTSDRMVDAIAEKLSLPPVSVRIYIEDILPPKQIEIAREKRLLEGKHVIPVPTFEVKKQFSGYFLDPLRIFRRKRSGYYEKTIVRPNYSYLGKYTISEGVINSIVSHELLLFKEAYRVNKVVTEKREEGIILSVEVTMRYGFNLVAPLMQAMENIKRQVERMTALNVLRINIYVKSLYVTKNK